MKITDIKQQLSNHDRFSIFINNRYSFSLNNYEVSELKLNIGQEINKEKLIELKNEVSFSKAKSSCLNLLSRRSRSEWELTDYLKRKEYNEQIINQTINFLSTKGYINDYSFSEQWIRNRLLLKHPSIIQLRQELRQKRIDESIIDQVISEQDIDEVKILKELISKKRETPRYKDDFKLMQYLSRKGYSYDKIKEVLGR